jgi:hypothetical protein
VQSICLVSISVDKRYCIVRPWNYSADYYPPMVGEASPFYVASRTACMRIARDLPDAKIIILLREPVARGTL